jgi:hypothetical protein
MNDVDLEAYTFEYMPEILFERLLRAVFTAHKLSSEECRAGFAETETVNLVPYHRRAKLEGLMRDVAARTAIEANVVQSDKSFWNHTELRSGPVVLTASSVQAPCGPVDISEFRRTLARSNQGLLWAEPGDVPANDAPLYVLLLHSRSRWALSEDQQRFGHLPGSAYIAYPTPDLNSYAHEINLFDRFPHVVESFVPQDWNAEAKISYLFNARKMRAA